MRIEIYEGGVRRLNLIFPTALIFNRVTAGIVAKAVQKAANSSVDDAEAAIDTLEKHLSDAAEEYPETSTLSRENLVKLCAELRKCSRRHPDMALVETMDADGDGVVVWM